jgi:hypothetical protein
VPAEFTDYVPRPPRYVVAPDAPLRLQVSCPADQPPIEGSVRLANLSRSGFGLRLAESVTVGHPIMVRVRHEGSALDLSLVGIVQWQKRQPDDTWLIGCRCVRDLAWETLGELFLLGVLIPGTVPDGRNHPAPATALYPLPPAQTPVVPRT